MVTAGAVTLGGVRITNTDKVWWPDDGITREPRLVTMAHSKSARGGRVYTDPFRNAYLQTIVSPYSVRRRPGATISTPLDWDEVTPRLDATRFALRTIDKRLALADPWADFKRHAMRLPA